MIVDMLEYYKMIKKFNIDIIYSGPLWSDGIEGIADTLKKRLEFDNLPLSASQSVFSVFIEQMNNMLMYSMEKEQFGNDDDRKEDISKGVFILGTKNKIYFVQSGNVMKSESVEPLKNKIDYLNTLDKAALRKYYKEQIKHENTNPESKGAGLGFIEIARRASSPIEYLFTPLDDGFVFFSTFITIGEGGN